MSAYTEADYAAARVECREAQAAARAACPPLSSMLDEFRRRRQQRSTEGLERRAALWGAPQQGGLSRGEAGRPGPRNVRFVR